MQKVKHHCGDSEGSERWGPIGLPRSRNAANAVLLACARSLVSVKSLNCDSFKKFAVYALLPKRKTEGFEWGSAVTKSVTNQSEGAGQEVLHGGDWVWH